jgi:hypothetical protein
MNKHENLASHKAREKLRTQFRRAKNKTGSPDMGEDNQGRWSTSSRLEHFVLSLLQAVNIAL